MYFRKLLIDVKIVIHGTSALLANIYWIDTVLWKITAHSLFLWEGVVIMGKQIIELIGELVEISGNPFVDGRMCFVIEVVSFSVAFGLVGKMFDALGFYD